MLRIEGRLNRVLFVSYDSLSTWLLAARQDEGAALREAKFDLIREFGSEAVPYYWAGFNLGREATAAIIALAR